MKKCIFVFVLAAFLLSGCTGPAGVEPEVAEQPASLYTPAPPVAPQPPEPIVEQDCITYSESSGSQQRNFHELLRTGEFKTAAQMETLKTQALSWQAEFAGMGSFAHIVAIESIDGSGQQVYISFGGFIDDEPVLFEKYEKMQMQVYDGTQARIGAFLGGNSGELILAYRFITDDYEWIEILFFDANLIYGEEDVREWRNITYWYSDEALQLLNQWVIEEGQFN